MNKTPFHSVQILGVDEAVEVCTNKPNHYTVVSIGSTVDPHPVSLENNTVNLCRLHFMDVDVDRHKRLPKEYQVPTPDEINKGITFAHHHRYDPLIIHCYAGISRSSAITFLSLYREYQDLDKSLAHLCQIKSKNLISPNPYIVKLGLRILTGSDAEFEVLKGDGLWQYMHDSGGTFFGGHNPTF